MSHPFSSGKPSARMASPLPPSDLPDLNPPQPGPDIFPEPSPVSDPIPRQDPNLPEPGDVTPPIVA